MSIPTGDIRTALDKLSQLPAPIRLCDKCGTKTIPITLDMALFGTEYEWQVEVPFCQSCDAGLSDGAEQLQAA
ncbi:MAG TPA: hypothetical protein VFA74_08100 [Terriglobales bacterium]|nr:hypothetical protein [Terriglobales bacterium]